MNKSVKKSVSLASNTISVIKEAHPDGNINWSRSLNDMTTRYALFVKHGLPALTDNEKMVIMACFGGRAINNLNIEHEIEMLHLQIEKGLNKSGVMDLLIQDTQLHDYGDDNNSPSDIKRRFCKKAKLWNTTQRLSILHHIESVWTNQSVWTDQPVTHEAVG